MIVPGRTGSPYFLTPDVVAAPRQVANVSQRPELPIATPDWWWGVAPGSRFASGNTPAPAVNVPGSATPPATPTTPSSGDSSGCC